VEATPARDLRGPLSDGTGAFRFDHTFPSVPPGNVRFCVVASYGTASTWWLQFIGPPKSVDRELTCSTVYVPSQVPRAPLGVLDRVDVSGRSVTAQGWAFDPNGGSPRVLLAVNGFPAAIGRTGLRRPDVARAVGGNGDAGFALSAELEAGTHDVCTLWEDTTTGRWSTPTCRQTVVK
jgi:hypothetical protein